jgi:peptide/nickel transport system permease protein
MLRFLVGRLIALVATLLVASFAIFGALYLAPGTPLSFLTRGRSVAPEQMAALKAQYHLDEPFLGQYWHWLSGVVHGDFGTSIIYKRSALALVGARAPNTVFLVVCAALLILVVGLAVGIVAGLRPGWSDSVLMLVATAAMAVPAFVAAIVLVTVMAVSLGWFPVFGSGDGFVDRLYHLVLPSVALALASVAYVARLTRASVRAEMTSEHVQTAVSRGLPYRLVVRRHVLRNASIPILTVAGLTVGSLIAGAVVVEQAFHLNGLGSYLVEAVQQKDFPVVQAISLLFVAAFIVINTLVDLLYSVLDPRVGSGRTT